MFAINAVKIRPLRGYKREKWFLTAFRVQKHDIGRRELGVRMREQTVVLWLILASCLAMVDAPKITFLVVFLVVKVYLNIFK